MSDRRIKHTKNYRLFERVSGNRECEPAKRKQLKESMSKYGWLPSMPMVCHLRRGKLTVADGQHRLAIAETLGIEVYYVLEDTDFDVALVNSTAKVWTLQNYAKVYAEGGKQDYAEGLKFHEDNRLPIGVAFAMLSGTTAFNNIEAAFKSGTFKVKDRGWAGAVASIYVPCVSASPDVRNARFLEACMAVCRLDGFDAARLLAGVERCREKLVSYSTREAYLEMIEEIYNFGRRQLVPIKVNALNAMKSRSAARPAKKKAVA